MQKYVMCGEFMAKVAYQSMWYKISSNNIP